MRKEVELSSRGGLSLITNVNSRVLKMGKKDYSGLEVPERLFGGVGLMWDLEG